MTDFTFLTVTFKNQFKILRKTKAYFTESTKSPAIDELLRTRNTPLSFSIFKRSLACTLESVPKNQLKEEKPLMDYTENTKTVLRTCFDRMDRMKSFSKINSSLSQ